MKDDKSTEQGYTDLGKITPNVPPGKPEENREWPSGAFGGADEDKPHPVPKQW